MERNRRRRWAICIVVGFFGLLAAVLAIAAEIKHVKVSEVVIFGDDCFYPSSPAWVLGIFAASSLTVAQIVATACGGCPCCCRRQGSKLRQPVEIIAILCLVVSWMAFSNAFVLLLEGAASNGQQQLKGQEMIHSCYILKPGVFAAGAGLSVATCALAITYYAMASSLPTSSSPPPILRTANHISSHHHHQINAYNADYSFTSAHLPYVSGLSVPEAYDDE